MLILHKVPGALHVRGAATSRHVVLSTWDIDERRAAVVRLVNAILHEKVTGDIEAR